MASATATGVIEAKRKAIIKAQASKRDAFIAEHERVFSELFPLAPFGTAEQIFGKVFDHDRESALRYQYTDAFLDGKKRRRSVLFAKDLSARKRVLCAVVAHLRHETTDYDRVLYEREDLVDQGEVVYSEDDHGKTRQSFNQGLGTILFDWGLTRENDGRWME